MNARERYYWDLNGHLVALGLLNKARVKATRVLAFAAKPTL